MPPETMTINTPMAIMPITMPLRSRSKRLPMVKKMGLFSPMIRLKPTMVMATRVSLRRKMLFTGLVLN